jgi:thymidine kinase
MDAQAVVSVTDRLEDIVYMCRRCGTETKRTVRRE